ncbi:hypothetical protein [Tautonia sociabilis]|uniref:Uncharacterized protein n=1 Tax=Tautonia sociabilis TaxID=2080755 RepID=A0A432MCZ6_9BACT|nr:hypothetical protein [Tautonia sociabilis]RUL82329.1 hypothetical protein TsocGM_23735 [Tautonia sociabilis]
MTDEVVVDRDDLQSTFWSAVAEDAKGIDLIQNTISVPKTLRTASTETPIQTVDPDGWGISDSTARLLLGETALVVGIMLRRRSA